MNRNMRGFAAIAALSTSVGTGCGGADPVPQTGDWAGTIRDSAGVTIVGNPATGTWTDEDRWTLTEELRIGTTGGDPAYQFGQITGIAELADGRLVVMDGQAQELRIFSADGDHLRTVGGAGSGPGEFGLGAGPVLIGPGDSIYVPDASNQRLNKFTPEADPVGSSPLNFSAGIPLAWYDTPSGRLVNQVRPLGLPGQPAADSLDLLLERGSDGSVIDTLLSFPSGGTFEFSGGVPEFEFFSAEPVWALTTSGDLVFGYNNEYRLRMYERGALVRVIEKSFEPKPVNEEDKQLMVGAMLRLWEEFGVAGPQLAVLRDAIGFAETYPAYALVRGGPQGSIWVQHLQVPSELSDEERENFNPQLGLGSPTWDVFDPEGRFMGELRMPERFQPIRIDDSRIYGVWRDELDVQYVLILRVGWPEQDFETG